MPPKTSSSATAKANKSNKEASDAINTYLSQKPNFDNLVKEAKDNPSRPLTETQQTEYSQKVKEAVREVLEERRAQAEKRSRTTEMPYNPKDDESKSNPTEKGSQETGPSNTKDEATFDHHKANPGPVMAENLGAPASKEELRKRAEELNKK